jgi:tetratricopeptide (TPR) repeat protein
MKVKLSILLSLFCLHTLAQDDAHAIRQGNQLYKKSMWVSAEKAYDMATDGKYRYIALMNKGNALYRQKKYDDAIKAYRAAAETKNKDLMLRSGAFYNAGVVFSSQKKIRESIEEYKKALRLNPDDQKARENLQKALLEQKQSGGGGSSQQQSPNQSDMSKSQAQKQLDKLEQKEKNISEKMSKEKSPSGGSAGRDW